MAVPLQEFLISLGFRVENEQFRRFNEGIKSAKDNVGELGKTMTEVSLAAFTPRFISLPTAIAARNEAVKRVLAQDARRLVDDAAQHLEMLLESYREAEPLTRVWLPSAPGLPGSPVPLDAATVTTLRLLEPIAALLPGPQQVPAAEQAQLRAANDKWRGYFARLCGDADATFE